MLARGKFLIFGYSKMGVKGMKLQKGADSDPEFQFLRIIDLNAVDLDISAVFPD